MHLSTAELVPLEETHSTLRPHQLTLTCAKCTRFRVFGVVTVTQAQREIAAAGWVQRNERTICPKCPK
jgi:hypothetical protein